MVASLPPSLYLPLSLSLSLSPSLNVLHASLSVSSSNMHSYNLHSLTTHRKALAVDGFPSEAVISEYLTSKNKLPRNGDEVLSWQFPQVISAQVVCHRLLEWPFEYTHKKMLSLVTQWCLRKEGVAKGVEPHAHVLPQRFVSCSCIRIQSCTSTLYYYELAYGVQFNAEFCVPHSVYENYIKHFSYSVYMYVCERTYIMCNVLCRVSHLRKRQGVQYYEVEWEADGKVATLCKCIHLHMSTRMYMYLLKSF